MYKAKLIQHLCSEEDSGQAVTVEKNIEISFVPVPHTSIGLLPTSQFSLDEYRIERVMYLIEKDLFLINALHQRNIIKELTYIQLLMILLILILLLILNLQVTPIVIIAQLISHQRLQMNNLIQIVILR